MPTEANFVSFVIRFVADETADESTRLTGDWHGVIRHVQSNNERHFTRWADAIAFISQFVDVGERGLDREAG